MTTDLHRAGVETVIDLQDNPKSPNDVPSCIADHSKDLSPCSFPRGPALRDSKALFKAEKAAAADSAHYLKVNDVLCPDALCPVLWYDGTIMYKDQHHLTATMSRKLAPLLGKRIDHALEG